MSDASSTELQGLIDRLRAGDRAAREGLIARSCDRLRQLTRAILKDFARVRRLEETDDVLHGAVLRLLRMFERQDLPASVRDFFRCASQEIRCQLLDLVRHHFGPEGPAVREVTNLGPGNPDGPAQRGDPTTSASPRRLAEWTEFHEQVGRLPEEEREAFDLLWYQGLTLEEAARVLGVAAITVKRRWASARLRLSKVLRAVEEGR
jgi:RNA polymerase sigma factor (sigma-70 family)